MAMKFLLWETPYESYTSRFEVTNLIAELIDGKGVIFIAPGKGFLAGIKVKFLYGDHNVASELGWWVEPKYRLDGVGKDLLEAFEEWAKEQGCTSVTMVALDDELDKFYRSKGYRLREWSYMKEL